LVRRGLSEKALELLNQAPPLTLQDHDLSVKQSLLSAIALSVLGRTESAQQHFDEAESTCTNPCKLLFELATTRGVLAIHRNQSEEAENAFRTSLSIARGQQDKFHISDALLNLGVAAVRQHRYDDAIDWSNGANQLAHSIGAGLTEEKALGNLGWSYYQMGDLDRSLALTLEAEKRARELGIVKDQLRWLYNAGGVYNAQGQFSLALDFYRKSFELAKNIGDAEQTMNALSSLSSVSVQMDQLDAARKFSQETFDLAHTQGDRLRELYALLTKGQIAATERQTETAEHIFNGIASDPKTEAPLLWQTQEELAHLYERENRTAAANQQYHAALSTLECARGDVAQEELRLSFLTNASEIYDGYISFLMSQSKTTTALQAADYSRAQTLAEGLGVLAKDKNCASRRDTTVDTGKAARNAGGPVLFYWLGQQQSYLWVIAEKQTFFFKLPAAKEIESTVQRYRKALLDPPDVLEQRNADGFKLYEMLVAPAERFIPRNSHVTVIADGVLNNLNFETLLVPGPKPHYWIEDVTVTNASSLRMLAASQSRSKRESGKLLLIGDPSVPDPKFPPLPNAEIEMQDIEKHFPPRSRQVFSGPEANPSAFFQSQPEKFSYIHFVAHGTASQLSPLDSAVILSKATAEEDSYKLHARDIINHSLHAELVVISTCYGSGTTLYNGEGLVGLSWAFLRAGAHNVIGALWQVNDRSTPRLMDRFYSEIQKGRSPEDALRAAKLELLHSDSAFRKPIYWAPFQLYVGS
jgi:CHAT domain-containing protein